MYRWTTLSLALCLAAIDATRAQAQTRLVTGRVYDDATQLGVPAATISVVDGTGAAQANADGVFRLTLPSVAARLRVRGIGYKERQIDIDAARTTLDVAMTRQALQLNEVVVTGSGTTQERQHVATAVSTVSGAELTTAPSASLENALQGKIVGASINMNSGAPGGGGQIQIRGVTSVLGNGEPLIVVDGVPFSNAAFSAGINAVTRAGSISGTLNASATNQDNPVNRLSDLNPADIESIQILKGAAASAIYGSQATNGVVLITTKRGRGGVSRFQLHQRAGTNTVDRLLGSRHFTHATLSDLDSATAKRYCPSDPCPYYDYQGSLYGQHNLAYETSLSLSGGTDLTNYFVSVNDKNDPGTMIRTGALRQNVRLNLDQSLGNRWTTSVSAAIYRSETARGISNNDNTFTSPIYVFAYTPAVADLRALGANGRPVDNTVLDSLPDGPGTNPFQTLPSIDNSEDVWRQTGSAVVRYNAWSSPRQTLNVSVTGGFDRYDAEGQTYSPNYLTIGTDTTLLGTAVQTAAVVRQYSNSASVVHTYTPTGAGRLSFINSLTTSAGFQYSDLATNRYSIVARGLLPTLENVDQGTPALNQLKSVVRNEAVYGNEEFLALNDKLSTSARLRAERSSVNGDPHRWFYWPAVAAAYRFVDLVPHADQIKLRASTGVSGNQPLYGLRDLGLAPPGVYDGRNSLVEPPIVGNAAIEPERMRESEIGVDASLYGNRIGLEASYYNRTITKLLLQATLAPTTGFGARYINGGTLTTAGVEVAVNVLAIHTSQFSWSSRAQYYASQSRLVSLAPGVADFQLGATGFAPQYGIGRIAQGYRSTLIWGNKVVVDSSGKRTVVAPLADANPYFQMAFGNEFTFHGLALHTLVDWRRGGSVGDLTQSQFDAGHNSWDYDKPSPNPTIGTTLGAYRVNSWQNGNNASTYIQDGSYVKLREVTLTYAIPTRYAQRFLRSRDARVSFSGRNLHTWTKYWSFDPEVSNFGNQPVDRFVDAFPYPPARSFMFGIDIGY